MVVVAAAVVVDAVVAAVAATGVAVAALAVVDIIEHLLQLLTAEQQKLSTKPY